MFKVKKNTVKNPLSDIQKNNIYISLDEASKNGFIKIKDINEIEDLMKNTLWNIKHFDKKLSSLSKLENYYAAKASKEQKRDINDLDFYDDNGVSDIRDIIERIKIYKKFIDKKADAEECYYLFEYYDDNDIERLYGQDEKGNDVIDKLFEKRVSFQYLERAAELGNLDACRELAELYRRAFFKISKKKVDFLSKAFLYQQKSICNTFGETIDEKFELALFYMDYYGLAKKKVYEVDYNKAFDLFKEIAYFNFVEEKSDKGSVITVLTDYSYAMLALYYADKFPPEYTKKPNSSDPEYNAFINMNFIANKKKAKFWKKIAIKAGWELDELKEQDTKYEQKKVSDANKIIDLKAFIKTKKKQT